MLPRALLCLAAALMVTGCSAPAFELIVSNTGDVTTYLEAGEGSGLTLLIEEEIGGNWQPLASSKAALCAPQCGVPGAIACASAAAELRVLHAVLPGDSASRTYDTTWWWLDSAASCIRSTTLSGPARATVCHSDEAFDANRDPIDEPTSSGVVASDGGANFSEFICDVVPFDLTDTTRPNLEISE